MKDETELGRLLVESEEEEYETLDELLVAYIEKTNDTILCFFRGFLHDEEKRCFSKNFTDLDNYLYYKLLINILYITNIRIALKYYRCLKSYKYK